MNISLAPAVVLAIALVAAPAAFAADGSSTVTLASDYLFDGISQTGGDPALQTSVDIAFDSGWYVGAWASNVDFGPGDPTRAEADLYAGYIGKFDGGATWEVGAVHYVYLGGPSAMDYAEVFAGLTLASGTQLKVWALDDPALGGSAWRAKLKHSFALRGGAALQLEGTRVSYSADGLEDYWHAQAGVARSFGRLDAYVGYSGTTRDANDASDGTALLLVSSTFDLF